MEQVLRRWWWRFLLLAAAVTLVLALGAGFVLRQLRVSAPGWLVVPLTVMGAAGSAGFLLPGVQRDLRRSGAAARGHRGGKGAAGQGR